MSLKLFQLLMCFGLFVAPVLKAFGAEDAEATAPAFDEQSLEFFEKSVRPILTARCLECHGGGKGEPKGGLRVDARSELLKGGDTGPAVVPGKPSESLLISAINYGDVYQMPPKSKMPAKEIAMLTKWVEMGAPWPKEANVTGKVKPFDLASRRNEHWCWRGLDNPIPPKVRDANWPLTTADRFILAKLEEKALKPAPQAERLTLLRRVYFDLIGLPPSVQEIDAYLKDTSPNALETVVDRLLSSVHFGERWGRHWLDLVRYAETRGHEFEPIIPNAWQYRDYVIRALNADVPYNDLLTEHIAGDLVAAPRLHPEKKTNESVLGTGFWFLGEEVHSPVDIRKDETDRIDNRLDVLSKTFLGLTVGCARCHDHKFDAISQRDYYAMAGFAISGSYRQVRVDTELQHREIAEKLDLLRTRRRVALTACLIDAAKPALDQLDGYLIAAKQLIDAGIKTEEARSENVASDDIVFADFEGDSWKGWMTEGTAFGERPVRKSDNSYEAPLEGFSGERFVNSHRNGPAGNNNAGVRDAHVGKLISPSFRLERNFIQFLVGGGNHSTGTFIGLIVDGKVVRTATGQNSGNLRKESWNVADLKGKLGHLEIVDSERGGWGHIIVDHIVFSDQKPPAASESPKPRQLLAESRLKSNQIAGERMLDADLLARWAVELEAARGNKQHPLHSFVNPSTQDVERKTRADRSTRTGSMELDADALVVDFGSLSEDQLLQDGVSFGVRPVRPGILETEDSSLRQGLSVATVGGWHRDLFWKDLRLSPGVEDDHGTLGAWHRHGRMVRSPEFTLSKGTVWYLVKGSVRAYATVNSHLVIAGPLHGGLLREFKHEKPNEWRWVGHPLEGYRGHRVHIEFSPADDGPCAVAMVAQQDHSPRVPTPNWAWFSEFDRAEETMEKRAKAYREAIQGAVTNLAIGEAFGERPDPIGRSNTSWAEVANWFVQQRELFVKEWKESAIDALDTSELAKSVKWESHLAPAMLEGNGVDEQLLVRGNSNTPKDNVRRRFLEAFDGAAGTEGTGSGRLQLAEQILKSPLAARVAVNRIWHHLFGRGIVPSVDNFGVLGQMPTHPELLDHLSTQFMNEGWSQKRLIKSLILSRTYQMSSRPDVVAEEADPENLLWHRMPIKRLEGEVIRDSLLAVSGRLNPQPFGPSIPIHLTPFMQGRGRPGGSGPLDGDGRRSIYIAVRRNFLSPMMLAFDTPSPFSTVGRRTISNVPAQALILMNDPLVIEQSRRLADRVRSLPSLSIEDRLKYLYLTCLGRPPIETELSEAVSFLSSYPGTTPVGQNDPRRETENGGSREAWADLCHVVFNLKEFIFIE